MKVTYYGHSCFATQVAGKVLLFDPFITGNELAKAIDKPADKPQAANDEEMIPPEAMQHLKPGRHTKFQNGSVWTMGPDGVPTKVQPENG